MFGGYGSNKAAFMYWRAKHQVDRIPVILSARMNGRMYHSHTDGNLGEIVMSEEITVVEIKSSDIRYVSLLAVQYWEKERDDRWNDFTNFQ